MDTSTLIRIILDEFHQGNFRDARDLIDNLLALQELEPQAMAPTKRDQLCTVEPAAKKTPAKLPLSVVPAPPTEQSPAMTGSPSNRAQPLQVVEETIHNCDFWQYFITWKVCPWMIRNGRRGFSSHQCFEWIENQPNLLTARDKSDDPHKKGRILWKGFASQALRTIAKKRDSCLRSARDSKKYEINADWFEGKTGSPDLSESSAANNAEAW